MAKTYYLGRTSTGDAVARASLDDYGYTHAAISNHGVSFSRTRDGAVASAHRWGKNDNVEIVPVSVVTAAEYRAAVGKKG